MANRSNFAIGRSISAGVQVNVLEFLDLHNSNRASSFSLKYGAGRLHILADERPHLFTLARIGHIRRDWEIDKPVLGEDDDR